MMPSPIDRSRAALPASIRKTLEESNLPVEVATAIADLCEGLLPPEVAAIQRYDIAVFADASWEAWPSDTGEWVRYADIASPLPQREEG